MSIPRVYDREVESLEVPDIASYQGQVEHNSSPRNQSVRYVQRLTILARPCPQRSGYLRAPTINSSNTVMIVFQEPGNGVSQSCSASALAEYCYTIFQFVYDHDRYP